MSRGDATLRVCADPNNLPYSNDQKQGFENQLAALIGKDLNMQVTYFWFPQREAFFRKTLNSGVCDVVMGVPAGFDEAATPRSPTIAPPMSLSRVAIATCTSHPSMIRACAR